MTLPRPRAILFDWDNTLVDTWAVTGRAVNITLETMGHKPWTEDEIRTRVAASLRDTFPKIYGDRWQEARDVFYKAFEEVHLDLLRQMPGADAVLKQAKGLGIYLGVVSNKAGKYLRKEAGHMGWDAYFAKLVGAQDAQRDKPALEPVHMALAGSAIDLGPDVWFVGDASIDVECGLAGGCTTVLVRREHYQGPAPDLHVADCSELLKALA